jgi:D-sedoheptulose 7-phosphate isomerase
MRKAKTVKIDTLNHKIYRYVYQWYYLEAEKRMVRPRLSLSGGPLNTAEFQPTLREAIQVFEGLVEHERTLQAAAGLCVAALSSGGKLLLCGNGGSASDAQHLAGELVGRYKSARRPLAAISLVSDVSVLTCISNDFDFQQVFSRQVHALANTGDVLLAFSTSGNSPNILAALAAAQEVGVRSIAFLGRDGGRAKALADCSLIVSHSDTARVQEGHQFLLHCLMDQVEVAMA